MAETQKDKITKHGDDPYGFEAAVKRQIADGSVDELLLPDVFEDEEFEPYERLANASDSTSSGAISRGQD